MLKAEHPVEAKDYEKEQTSAGDSVFAQYSSTSTLNQDSAAKLLGNQYSRPTFVEFAEKLPRILATDRFRAQIIATCIQRATPFREIALIIPGGLTGL